MKRAAVRAGVALMALGLVLVSALLLAAGVTAKAPHRPLPRRLGVDEGEYWVYPSHNPVAAGRVEFHATNFGMDAHDFSIRNGRGAVLSSTPLASGAQAVLTIKLAPGTYTLFCSISNHEALGMRARLAVKYGGASLSRTRGVGRTRTRGQPRAG